MLLPCCKREADCSWYFDDGFASLAWSDCSFCLWVPPFSSYLAKSCLKLGLFFLAFWEFIPELPEWLVRPISRLVCADPALFCCSGPQALNSQRDRLDRFQNRLDRSLQIWCPSSDLVPRVLNFLMMLRGTSSLWLSWSVQILVHQWSHFPLCWFSLIRPN